MNEESQVRGCCCNITFIYTNQETVSALPCIQCIGAQLAAQTERPASAGTLWERGSGGDDDDDDVELHVLGCRLTY